MITGSKCFEFLINKIKEKDIASSSYWDQYHTTFTYDGNQFDGLQLLGTYRKNARSSVKEILAQFKDRVLQTPYRKPYNKQQFKQLDVTARMITKNTGQEYGLDRLRHTLTLDLLLNFIPAKLTSESKVCVIGDGYATMTSLLLESKSAGQVFLINLNKSLLVDLHFLKKIFSENDFENNVCLARNQNEIEEAVKSSKKVVVIMAGDYELLQHCPVSVAINIASMQEMDKEVIENYFQYLRRIACERDLFFYCCNRESKQLPDGQMINFAAYPWKQADKILIDELCPWHQKYYTSSPPFYHKYDGPIRHRLTQLAP